MNQFELPMYSPHPRAKLFQRFTFEREMQVEGVDLVTQLTNYVNYKTFKWILVGKTEKGRYKPLSKLEANSINFTIQTNSLSEIKQDDIIFLKHPIFKEGRYFTVEKVPEIDFMYCPKPRQSFQYISLVQLDYKQPNDEVK